MTREVLDWALTMLGIGALCAIGVLAFSWWGAVRAERARRVYLDSLKEPRAKTDGSVSGANTTTNR